jgi:hypothetical protein
MLFQIQITNILFLLLLSTTQSADVTPGMGLLAYFANPNFRCPTGWTDAGYGGMLIKGWGGSSGTTGLTGGTALSADNSIPTHQHSSWSMTSTFTSTKSTALVGSGSSDAIDDNVSNTLDQTKSTITGETAALPYVTLALCRFDSGTSFVLPPGIVAFFSASVTSCPTTNGWGGDFTDANGRFLVFAKSTVSSGAMSSATASTTSQANIGDHSHAIPQYTYNVVSRNVVACCSCCSPNLANYVSTNTWSSSTASSNHLNLPYIQLRACKSTGDGSVGNNFYPPQEAIFYYDGNSCPSGVYGTWRESTATFANYDQSAIAGRLVYNRVSTGGSGGTSTNARGGTQLYLATSTTPTSMGHDSHSHTISASGYNFAASGLAGSWDSGSQTFCKRNGYSFSIPTSANTASLIPYKVLRACNPPYWVQSSSPTQQPTTPPSKSPSRAPTMSGPCQLNSPVKFNTWLSSVNTYDPVMYPTNDWELAWILSTAKAHNCKVRPAGTGHSEDGIIKQHAESNVIMVSLADYVPPSDWNNILSTTTPSVKLSCGKTWMHLMAIARPNGYVLPTSTAGFFFSIGGVVMNPSVHGGAYNEERMNYLLLSARVMLANGTSVVISGEEIKVWRGSLGLLGIATGCEIKVKQDQGLQMSTLTQTFNYLSGWSQASFNSYMHSSFDVANSSEWFLNPYSGEIQTVVIKQNANVTPPPSSVTQPLYDTLLANFGSSLGKTGGQVNDQNAMLVQILGFIGQIIPKTTAELVMGIGFTQQVDYLNAALPRNDGYFIPPDGLTKFNQLHFFVPCITNCIDDGRMFTTVNASWSFFRDVINNPSSTWFPTLALEWRIITIKPGTLLLEHMIPGKYISLELVNIQDTTPQQYYLPYFKQLEDTWYASIGAIRGQIPIHHGKSWGLDYVSGLTNPYAFQNSAQISNTYTTAVKNAFIDKMNNYDPTGLFRGGEGLRMLGLSSTVKFEPRGSQGDHCNVDAECIDSCCTSVTKQCIDAVNKLASGVGCEANCQCQSGVCFPWVCW